MKEESFFDKEELEILNSPYVGELFKDINRNLSEPLFTITDFGLSARDASYWDDKGILPNHCGTGKRRRYNLVQGAWIKLIQQLRDLGVGTDVIKKLKENLLDEQVSLQDVLKNPKAKAALEMYLESIGKLDDFKSVQDDPELQKDAEKPILSLFGLIVKHCVVFRKPLAIMVFPDGSYVPNNLKTLRELNEHYENVDDILNTPHSVVSISRAYQDLVVGWKDRSFFEELGIITEQEKEILRALKEPNLKSVEVRTRDGVLDILAICKEQKLDPATRVSELIAKNGFHHIDIKTRNGKTVHYENKIIKKLKRT